MRVPLPRGRLRVEQRSTNVDVDVFLLFNLLLKLMSSVFLQLARGVNYGTT